MKSNKHIYIFKNQTIVVEHKKKFSRFTGLKILLKHKKNT